MPLGADNNYTLLVMTPVGVPLYSARGLSQTLTPAAAAKPVPRRTINGEARFLGGSQMQKYDSTITCTDQRAPAFGGLWPGEIVTVHCVAELAYVTAGGSPERGVAASYTEGAYTFYRPIIDFMVVDYETNVDEYPADWQWRLTLTEQ